MADAKKAAPALAPAADAAKSSPPAAASSAAAVASSPSPAAPSASASAEHPLETPWTFYFDRKLQTRDGAAPSGATGFDLFKKNLQTVGTFDSLEGFWRHYSYMQPADQLPREHNLYLFRHNLLPAWETFPKGGCWYIKVRKGNGVVNRLWEELAFACIGEWFEDPDVMGCALSTRTKDDNIQVWNKDGLNARIGERLKDLLNLDESTQVEYKPFARAIQDGSSFRGAQSFTYAPAL